MRITLSVLAFALAGCAALTARATGAESGSLQACPDAPRCVVSGATDERHAIGAFTTARNDEAAWAEIKAVLASTPRTTLAESGPRYLRAEARSASGLFTDDLELLWRPEAQRIDVRSASRVGYYDFGVNRRRVEGLREEFARRGIVKP